jgi:hypothetical protein
MSEYITSDPKILIAFGELLLKAAAVLAAAIWAVLLLRLLRQREQAEVNIRKSEAEIRDLDLKQKYVEAQIADIQLKTTQAVILVDIGVKTHRHRDAYLMIATVELTNLGSQNTRIMWKDQPHAFSVRMVELQEGEGANYKLIGTFPVPRTLDPTAEALSHVVRAGGKEVLPFAARISCPGLYLLSFRIAVDERDRAEAKKLGVELPTAWTGNRYVLVDDTQVACAGDSIHSDVVANLK